MLRAAQTCRNWRFLAEDNLLWKEKCRQAGIEEITRRRCSPRSPGSQTSPWKAAYMRQHAVEMNWRSKPIRQPKMLKGHDDHVITCLQFCGNRIVSGSDDNTLKVWSAITGKVEMKINKYKETFQFKFLVFTNVGWSHWWCLVVTNVGWYHYKWKY